MDACSGCDGLEERGEGARSVVDAFGRNHGADRGLTFGRPVRAIAVGDLALDHGGPKFALAGVVGGLDLAGEEREGQELVASTADLVLDGTGKIAGGRGREEVV